MRKKHQNKTRDVFSFIFSGEGLDILSVGICFFMISFMVKNDYSIVSQIGIVLITIYLGIKIYVCYEAQKEASELEYKIEKLEKELSSSRDRINQKTEEITKLKKELEKSDDLLFRITGSKRN